jgi:AbrB family looped-hinge helix DNA binding protein
MARTRVSPKYQIVIPKEVRESMDLRVGQELQVVSKGGVITLIPERPVSSLRGFARGIRTDKLREKKDRTELVTSDRDFETIRGVTYLAAKKSPQP